MGVALVLIYPYGKAQKQPPFPSRLYCVGSVLAVKGSLRRFAPWTAPVRSERRAAYEGKGGDRAVWTDRKEPFGHTSRLSRSRGSGFRACPDQQQAWNVSQRREPRIQRHIGFSGNQVRRGWAVASSGRPGPPYPPSL